MLCMCYQAFKVICLIVLLSRLYYIVRKAKIWCILARPVKQKKLCCRVFAHFLLQLQKEIILIFLLQELVIGVIPNFVHMIDYSSLKSAIIPRMKVLLTKSRSLLVSIPKNTVKPDKKDRQKHAFWMYSNVCYFNY